MYNHEKRSEDVKETLKKLYHNNPRLTKALDNDLFLKITSEIINLPYELHLNDKRKNKSMLQTMRAMIRFECITEEGDESIIWVYFPRDSESKSVHCRLQKHAYSSDKVKQPKASDNRGYPRINVHNEKDIEHLISCINEYMTDNYTINS